MVVVLQETGSSKLLLVVLRSTQISGIGLFIPFHVMGKNEDKQEDAWDKR